MARTAQNSTICHLNPFATASSEGGLIARPPTPSIRVLRSELGQIAVGNELKRSDEICSHAAVSEEVRCIFDNARQNNLPNDA
jgi:hypothetical protein